MQDDSDAARAPTSLDSIRLDMTAKKRASDSAFRPRRKKDAPSDRSASVNSSRQGPKQGTPRDTLVDRREIGQRLRMLRKSRELTLKQICERSGVALSTLSKMELGQITVSYDKLAAVSRALGADLSRLLADGLSDAGHTSSRPTFVRSLLAAAPRYGSTTYDYKLLGSGFPGRRMTPLYARVTSRHESEFTDYIRHRGQEFVMVLAGSVRIRFETGESVSLAKGEAAYFDSGIGHMYLSTGRGAAQVVIVMSEE